MCGGAHTVKPNSNGTQDRLIQQGTNAALASRNWYRLYKFRFRFRFRFEFRFQRSGFRFILTRSDEDAYMLYDRKTVHEAQGHKGGNWAFEFHGNTFNFLLYELFVGMVADNRAENGDK